MQQALFDPAPSPTVTVHTDGGCDPNPGPGGWAAVIRYEGQEIVLYGNHPSTTNNQMELEAAVAALAYLSGRYGRCEIDLHTDSRYLRQGIAEWIDDWFARGWKTKGGQPVKNQELWRRLYELSHAHQVYWHWIKGHAGDPLNERVDRLAGEARALLTEPAGPRLDAPDPASPTVPASSEVQISIAVSCQGGSGPGGWAAVIRCGDEHSTLCGYEAETTSNALYLQAATEALGTFRQPQTIAVYAASDYLIQGATQWAHDWQRRRWQTASGEPVRNRAGWEALLQAAGRHRVVWQAAKGRTPSADLSEARRMAGESIAQHPTQGGA